VDGQKKMDSAHKISIREKSNDSSDLFFEKPKILLIDLHEDSETILKISKLNISNGSFGNIYKIRKADGYLPIIDNSRLPEDFAEQDIIIIDLKMPDFILPEIYYQKEAESTETNIFSYCIDGFIDPRPLAMFRAKEKLDRILLHGGIFIIFADMRFF
jgi:hypothetical protein